MGFISGYYNQSWLGLLICNVIFFGGLVYLVLSIGVKLYYRETLKDFEGNKDSDNPSFDNNLLDHIYSDFVNSISLKTDNVNTQVIISKHIPKILWFLESILSYIASLSVILGLFGTFVGLTGSIEKIKSIIDALSTTPDLQTFISGMNEPMADMATAFYTSIAGILVSIFVTFMEKTPWVSYKYSQQRVMDGIEDYLDNVVYATKVTDDRSLLVNFTNKVESSIKYMADKVTETFSNGIDRFSDRINYISLDLKESARTLSEVIGRLENAVTIFSAPVLVFKESIEDFRKINDVLDIKIDNARNIVQNLRESFDMTINSFDSNREMLSEVGDALNKSMLDMIDAYSQVNETYKHVKVIVDDIDHNSKSNDSALHEALSEIKDISLQLRDITNSLKHEINGMSANVANQMSDSFEKKTNQISQEICARLNKPIDEVKEQNKYFDQTMDKFSLRLDTYQKMIEEVQVRWEETAVENEE